MKSTGITRKIDELGRIVLPMELRNRLDIQEKDPMEIYVEGSSIILKKFEPNCIFCGSSRKLTKYNGKEICRKCSKNLKQVVEKQIAKEKEEYEDEY